jgi:hypothetical protein
MTWPWVVTLMVSNVAVFFAARATTKVVVAEPLPRQEPTPTSAPPQKDHIGIGTYGGSVSFTMWSRGTFYCAFHCSREYARGLSAEILAVCDVLEVSAPRTMSPSEGQPTDPEKP